MAKDNTNEPGVDRRAFLRGVGLGAGAAAVTAVAAVGAQAAEPAPKAGVPEGKAGYQLTDHVRQAYDAARY